MAYKAKCEAKVKDPAEPLVVYIPDIKNPTIIEEIPKGEDPSKTHPDAIKCISVSWNLD